jgi:hypothetical protein
MSNHGSNPTFTLNHQASTSTNPHQTMPASYHPQPRPPSAPPLQRVDIHGIKQELHDALGEQGLPYWKALNGYLLGQLGRGELQDMVKGWLKGKKGTIHSHQLLGVQLRCGLRWSHGKGLKLMRLLQSICTTDSSYPSFTMPQPPLHPPAHPRLAESASVWASTTQSSTPMTRSSSPRLGCISGWLG